MSSTQLQFFSSLLTAVPSTMRTAASSAAAFVVNPPARTLAGASLARHAAACRPSPPPAAAAARLLSRGRRAWPAGCGRLAGSAALSPPSLVLMAGDAPPAPVVTVDADGAAVGDTLGARVRAAAAAAVSARGVFRLAVSGGSLPKTLAAGLEGAKGEDMPWSSTVIYFADERVVPLTDDDSNYKLVAETLLAGRDGTGVKVVKLTEGLAPPAAAADYEEKLKGMDTADGVPVFDMILLGMGPDGHTASLFPGHPLLDVSDAAVAFITDAPKPPPGRITLTLPVLNAGRSVLFVTTGGGKAEVLHEIFHGGKDVRLPAARVRPATGVEWLLDAPAAAQLSSPFVAA